MVNNEARERRKRIHEKKQTKRHEKRTFNCFDFFNILCIISCRTDACARVPTILLFISTYFNDFVKFVGDRHRFTLQSDFLVLFSH